MTTKPESSPELNLAGQRAPAPRPEIGLGDLAQAYAHLRPAAEAAIGREIAALLGLRLPDQDQIRPVAADSGSDADRRGESKTKEEPEPGAGSGPHRPDARKRGPAAGRPLRARAEQLVDVAAQPEPAWLESVELDKRELAAAQPARPLQMLIPPGYVRATMAQNLAVPVAEGAPDIPHLVDLIARGEPIATVPRAQIPSLRQGVQLLVDISPSLAPFMADQDYLVAQIEDLVSLDNLNLFWFEDHPLKGVYGPDDDYPRPYEPPPAGAMVLLLTDLGIGRLTPLMLRASAAQWRQFAARVNEADAQLLAMVPYAAWRWPGPLRRILPLIPWEHGPARPRPGPAGQTPQAPALRSLAGRNPQALELLKALALVARIDQPLLRAARLALLPTADAGTEADIWLSPLALARSPSALLLNPQIAAELRELLAADGGPAVERAWRFLESYRQKDGSSYDTRQEERIYYLTTHPGLDGPGESKKVLQEALAVLVRGAEEQIDVSRWALRAMPRLPRPVRTLPEASDLYYAAAVRLGIAPADESILPNDVAKAKWLRPKDTGLTSLGVELVAGGLKFSRQPTPAMMAITVAEAAPVLLDVSWPIIAGSYTQQIAVGPGPETYLAATTCQVITLSGAGAIRRWRVDEGREIAAYGAADTRYQCIAVNPDGRYLGGGDADGRVSLWDLQTGKLIWQQQASFGERPPRKGEPIVGGILALAFSSNSQNLATADAHGLMRLLHVPSGRQIATSPPAERPITGLSFSPDGSFLLTSGAEIWDIAEMSFIAAYSGRALIRTAAFRSDGSLIAFGAEEGLVEIYESTQLALVQSRILTGPIDDLAFNPDGSQLAIANKEGVVLWAVGGGTDAIIEIYDRPCSALAYSPDGDYLFALDRNGQMQILDLSDDAGRRSFTVSRRGATALVAFTPPAATFTIRTGAGRQYEIRPDERPLTFPPLFNFDEFIDSSRLNLHPEVQRALEQIDAWLGDGYTTPKETRRAFLATGGRASGKSTLASALVDLSRGLIVAGGSGQWLRPDFLAAIYFADSDEGGGGAARPFILSLAIQLAQRLPSYADHLYALGLADGALTTSENGSELVATLVLERLPADKAAALWQRYVLRPLWALATEAGLDDLVILIHDLHKADEAPAGAETILDILPLFNDLPPAVRFIFISRANAKVQVGTAPLNPARFALSTEAEGESESTPGQIRKTPSDLLTAHTDLDELWRILVARLDSEALRTLSSDLGIDLASLAGNTQTDRTRELLILIDREGRLDELQKWLERKRPDISWPSAEPRPDQASAPAGQQLREVFVNRLHELKTFSSMIQDRRGPRIMLIEGEAGIGKTFLMQRMALQFRDNNSIFATWLTLDNFIYFNETELLKGLAQNLGAERFPNFMEQSATAQGDRAAALFFRELSRLADSFEAVVIFIDNFDQAPQNLQNFTIFELLPYVKRQDNLLFVVAGRGLALAAESLGSVATTIRLAELAPEDVREYLARQGITEADAPLIEEMLATVGGNPAALATLVAELESRGDPDDYSPPE